MFDLTEDATSFTHTGKLSELQVVNRLKALDLEWLADPYYAKQENNSSIDYAKVICSAPHVKKQNIEVPLSWGHQETQNEKDEAEAWLLISFVRLNKKRSDTKQTSEVRLEYAVALGCLFQWWTLRQRGLEHKIASRIRSNRAQRKATEASKASHYGRRLESEDWKYEARAEAKRIRRTNPLLKAWPTAQRIAPAVEKADRTVYEAIKHLWNKN